MKWCGDGKTEPMENLYLGNGISVSAITKKLKNGHHFINIDCTEKFQITDPSNKVWVSSFPSVNGNGISMLAIMKKSKNGHHFINIDHIEKFQITNPFPQSLGLWFPECWWKWNISVNHYEKIEKWPPFHKYWSYRKISNYQPPQSLGLRFSKCWQKWNISVNHYKKTKKWLPFCKYRLYRKISNYQPPKVWVSSLHLKVWWCS